MDLDQEFAAEQQQLRDFIAGTSREFEVSTDPGSWRTPTTDLDQDRVLELIEDLVELDYLPEDARSGTEYDDSVQQAVDAFRRESDAGAATADRIGQPPDEIELQWLSDLASFDDTPSLPPLAGHGTANLTSRVLHYRLRTLGLYADRLDAAVGPETDRGLAMASAVLGELPTGVDAVRLLGDTRLLVQRFVTRLGKDPLVFFGATDKNRHDADFERIIVVDGILQFRKRWWKRLRNLEPSVHDDLLMHVERRGAASDTLGKLQNRFGLELLQLVLWTSDHYAGRVDGWWGQESADALWRAIKEENLERKEILLALGGGYWAVNAAAILGELTAPAAASEEATIADELAFVSNEAGVLQKNATESRSFFGKAWGSIRKGFRKAAGFGRKVFRGARNLLRTIARGIKKGFHWIQSELARLTASAVSFFKFFFRGIREGLHLLVRSFAPFLHFICRKPLVARNDEGRPVAVARFALDADGFQYASDEAGEDELRSHAGLMLTYARGLGVALPFVGKVLNIIFMAALGPVNWVMVGFRLSGAFLEIVRSARGEPA